MVQETKINLCYMLLYFLKNTNMDTIKICKPITSIQTKVIYTSLKFLKSIKLNKSFIH